MFILLETLNFGVLVYALYMLEVPNNDKKITEHYGQGNLATAIFDALSSAGKYHTLTEDDLMPADQFHIGGQAATLELADLAGITSNMVVLDVGGGIGGPARTLASTFGCKVEVLDLTEEYCKVGEQLTDKTAFRHLVSFRHGSALDLPYSHQSFDLVWTQHSSMNIADKSRLYSEICRVLKIGGRFAMHEIMEGKNSPIYFPVPWARHPAISFLSNPNEIRSLIISLGFKEIVWIDETSKAVESFKKAINSPSTHADSPLGLQLLLGKDYKLMLQNQLKNLEENKICVVKAVYEKEIHK